VPEICQSQSDKISRTLYTQPSLYVVESILADLMGTRTPTRLAGHSLGEYIALRRWSFDWAAGLRLVKRRAELMDSRWWHDGCSVSLTANNWNSKSKQTRCGAG